MSAGPGPNPRMDRGRRTDPVQWGVSTGCPEFAGTGVRAAAEGRRARIPGGRDVGSGLPGEGGGADDRRPPASDFAATCHRARGDACSATV